MELISMPRLQLWGKFNAPATAYFWWSPKAKQCMHSNVSRRMQVQADDVSAHRRTLKIAAEECIFVFLPQLLFHSRIKDKSAKYLVMKKMYLDVNKVLCTKKKASKQNCSRAVLCHASLRTSLLSNVHYSPYQQNQDEMEMRGGMSEGRFRASAWI